MGRIDDVINVAGHRLSAGAIEAVVSAHPSVAECAVIGGRRRPQGAAAAGIRRTQGRGGVRWVVDELIAAVRDEIGAVASFKTGRHRGGTAEDPVRQDPP